MASELHRVGLPIDSVDPRRDRAVLAVADLEIAGSEPDDLSVLQVGHTGRVGSDRHRVAGQQVLVVPHADHQGAAESRADNLARTRQADHAQAIRSLEPGQDLQHGLEWLAGSFQFAADQVRDDLGIGLALEDETLCGEFPPQHRMVFDHPVVHDRDSVTFAAAAQMGVGVAIGGRSVRGPARMADSALTCQGLLLEQLFQHPHPAGALPQLDPPIIDCGQSRAIVAAILEPAQPRHQNRAGLMHPCVTNDSTHRLEFPLHRSAGTQSPGIPHSLDTRTLSIGDCELHYQFSMKTVNG
jgi:hypothetical protein